MRTFSTAEAGTSGSPINLTQDGIVCQPPACSTLLFPARSQTSTSDRSERGRENILSAGRSSSHLVSSRLVSNYLLPDSFFTAYTNPTTSAPLSSHFSSTTFLGIMLSTRRVGGLCYSAHVALLHCCTNDLPSVDRRDMHDQIVGHSSPQ